MTDAAEERLSSGEESPTEQGGAASAAAASPMAAPSEPSSSGRSSSSALDGKSDLLEKIKDLHNHQKALREEKKKCAMEMKNAMKRKKDFKAKRVNLAMVIWWRFCVCERLRKKVSKQIQYRPHSMIHRQIRREACLAKMLWTVRRRTDVIASVYIHRFCSMAASSCDLLCIYDSLQEVKKKNDELMPEHSAACVDG